MGKHAKLKEKQKWAEEKIHLDNARKLRGIYFIDPEDKEYKETIKNARKKLETSMALLMYPEFLIRVWMSSKRNASMSIGISMDQEICLTHGQVSLNLLHWKRNVQTDICGGETDKKAANIQARSFMARTLDRIGKKCPAEGEAKVVT